MRSASGMYQKFINKFNETKCCPLCVRKFAEPAQEDNFIVKLENILNRVPTATKSAEMSLVDAENKLKKLEKLHNVWVDCERLSKNEIPSLRSQKEAMEEEKRTLTANSDDAEDEIATMEVEISQLNELKRSIAEFSKQKIDVGKLEQEVTALRKDLQESGLGKTMDEIQTEHEQVQADTKMIRGRIERLTNENRIKHQTLQGKQNRMRDLKETELELQFKLKEREQLFNEVQALNEDVIALKKQLAENQIALQGLPQSISTIEKQLNEFRTEKSLKEEAVLLKIQESKDALNQLSSVNDKILKYRRDCGQERLENCTREISKLSIQLKHYQDNVEALNKEMDDIINRKTELQLMHRNIKDNLQYRRMRKDLADVENKILVSQKKLQSFDLRTIEIEYNDAEGKHAALIGERAHLLGELKQIELNLSKTQKDYDMNYRNSAKKFLELKYEVKSLELSNSDLQTYYVALDQAIMQFHSTKMSEINSCIKEIWMKTYSGSDIDTLKICSDQEIAANGTRKSYNYRVVMVKGGIEMDMKGRCSAGQKVLASIIIRLALAETFCFNCGILALDEPTTVNYY